MVGTRHVIGRFSHGKDLDLDIFNQLKSLAAGVFRYLPRQKKKEKNPRKRRLLEQLKIIDNTKLLLTVNF